MRTIKFILLVLFLSLLPFIAPAGNHPSYSSTNQAKIELLSGGYDDDKILAGLSFDIAQNWHTYWREAGDTGFPPEIDWSSSTNVKSAEIQWPYPKRLRTEIVDGYVDESYVYENKVILPLIVVPENKSQDVDLKLKINYAMCSDVCIPEETTLSIKIPSGYKSKQTTELIKTFLYKVPTISKNYKIVEAKEFSINRQRFLKIEIESDLPIKNPDIFLESGNKFAFYNPVASIGEKKVSFTLEVNDLTKDTNLQKSLLTATFVNNGQSYTLKIPSPKSCKFDNSTKELICQSPPYLTLLRTTWEGITKSAEITTWYLILISFIGGFILNLMPCVLPVLSIKLMSIIKYSRYSRKMVIAGFLTTALGIITSFLLLALLIIGLKQFGVNVGWGFHFQQPAFIIFMAVISSLFAANLWGLFEIRLPSKIADFVANKPNIEGLAGNFLTGVFATLLATPCTAPLIGTAVGFAITSGNFEIILTFLMIGLGMALPYILISIFPRFVHVLPKPGKWMITVKHIMGSMLIITTMWLIWVLSNQLGQIAAIILALIIFIKNIKLWASRHVTFLKTHKILITSVLVILSFLIPLKVSQTPTKPKSDSYWMEFDEAKIQTLVKEGHTVFVDITASWCLTCKVNKTFVIETSDIKNEFDKLGVIAMRGDWTNRDDHITDYLKRNKRIGIPFNIIYSPKAPGGIILSELLSKDEVRKKLNMATGK